MIIYACSSNYRQGNQNRAPNTGGYCKCLPRMTDTPSSSPNVEKSTTDAGTRRATVCSSVQGCSLSEILDKLFSIECTNLMLNETNTCIFLITFKRLIIIAGGIINLFLFILSLKQPLFIDLNIILDNEVHAKGD